MATTTKREETVEERRARRKQEREIAESQRNSSRKQMMKEWNPPTYDLGTRVIYSHDPTRTDRQFGFIIEIGGRGMADIQTTHYTPGGGFLQEIHESCYLLGDPMVAERPPEFWNGENGVYILAPIEEKRLALEADMVRLQRELKELLGNRN